MKSSVRTLSLVLVVLLVCCISSYAQRQGAKTKTTPQPQEQVDGGDGPGAKYSSPSGKVVVSGSHSDLVGMLTIHVDQALKGWIHVSVGNESGNVKQGKREYIAFPLTRDEDYSKKIDLAPGSNLITVKNAPTAAADLEGKEHLVRFKWVAEVTETAEERVQEGAKPLPAGAVPSKSNKLAIIALHDDEKAMIRGIVHSSLNGPFKITVEDGAGKVHKDGDGKDTEKTVDLKRNQSFFDETISLRPGKNVIKIAGKDKEAAEVVELEPFEVKGAKVAEKKPFSFKPSDSKISTSGNISAEATRVDGRIELRVQAAESVSGFTVDVVDKNNKTVAHEEYTDLPRGKNSWTSSFKAGEGANKVKVAAASGEDKDKVELDVAATEKLAPLAKDANGFEPSTSKRSDDGKITAEATRTRENTIELRALVDNSIPAVTVVVKDKDSNEVYNRAHELARELIGWWSLGLPAGPGENTVTITPLRTETKEGVTLTVDAKFKLAALDADYLIPNSASSRAIIGFEQIGASSAQGEAKPFVDLFLSAPLRFWPSNDELARFSTWGNIRLSAIPSQVATLGTIPANFTNPLAEGGLTNKLVQSFDFLAGFEFRIFDSNRDWDDLIPGIKQRTTVSLVVGGGATSPLSSTKTENVQIFAVPADTNPQRELFVARYGLAAANKKYIGFVFPERDRFLRQYYGGVRFKTYYFDKGGKLINRFPALLDVMLGQNEAVTGGQFKSDVTDDQGKFEGRKRAYVLRLEAFYPLPIKEASFLYLFGSAALKIGAGGVKIERPLILNRAGDEVRITDDDVFIAPTLQSSRDTYRIGIGVNLIDLFKRSRTSQ